MQATCKNDIADFVFLSILKFHSSTIKAGLHVLEIIFSSKINMKLTMDNLFGFLLLLIFFLAFQEEVMQAEATICSAESNSYRGMCWIHRNCQIACEKDGFLDGNCHGLRRKCICTKPCSGGGGGAGGGSTGAEGGDGDGGSEGGDGGDGGSGEGGDGGSESGGEGGGERGDGGSAPPLEV